METERNAFTAGVRPGGLTSTDEVLVLLCRLLSDADVPVTFAQLRDTLIGQELVNYFEFADMMERMCAKGYAQPAAEGDASCYTITPLGKKTAVQCSYNLPAAVVERAGGTLAKILLRQRREKENDIVIDRSDNGWRIGITMHDIGGTLLQLALALPTEEDCRRVRDRFLEDPETFYRQVLSAAAGEI